MYYHIHTFNTKKQHSHTHTHVCVCAMQEMWFQSLGWEDLLEEGVATHSSILVRESYGQRSLASYSPGVHKESDTTEEN